MFNFSKIITTSSCSPENIYNVVLDVEQYPNFLPYCKSLRIISKGNEEIVADMTVSYKLFKYTYRSVIAYKSQPDGSFAIAITSKTFPFKSLETNWKFCGGQSNGAEAVVDFNISFSFKVPALNIFLRKDFTKYTDIFVSAFIKRAEELYGTELS